MTQSKKYDLESLKEVFQEYLVKKSPIALPENAKETIAKIAPILTIIGIVISVIIVLPLLGIGLFALPFAAIGGYHATWATIVSIISAIGSIVLSVMILPGLSKRTKKVWNIMYYFCWFGVAINLLSLNLVSAIFSGLIGFFLLFQLRDKYTN